MTETGYLLLVSMNEKAAQFMKDDLGDIFGGLLDIRTYCFRRNDAQELERLLADRPALVIATGLTSFEKISALYPQGKIIRGIREIAAPQYFDKLFMIPRGERVLVVNETRDGAIETMQSVMLLNINHLSYEPYWEGCETDVSGFNVAISPGMLAYCPKSIKLQIDIGMRKIACSTFYAILETFSLGIEYMDLYVRNSKSILVDTYKRLSDELLIKNELMSSLRTILNELDEAIIVVDRTGSITRFNSSAEKLFHRSEASVQGQNIYAYLHQFHDLQSISDVTLCNGVYQLGEQQVYMDYIPITGGTNEIGYLLLRQTAEIQKKEAQVRQLLYKKHAGYIAKYHFSDLICCNQQMSQLIGKAEALARTDSSILITGESGTGKELFAQSIHNCSTRWNQPFVAVNFAALPESLIESELFGYEEGAFTGAKKSGRKGLFEAAHGGTIFLDEIGDASMSVQARLLRVLEEKEIMRLGDTKIIPIDVRVIVATNKDLRQLIREGKFREDLYYRIGTFHLHIPPLRERTDAILPLARFFMAQRGVQKTFSSEAADILLRYSWHGNVRELKHVIEHAIVMSAGPEIAAGDLPYDLLQFARGQTGPAGLPSPSPAQREGHAERAETDAGLEELRHFLLRSKCDGEILRAVLELLYYNAYLPRPLGRKKMVQVLGERGLPVSEGSLRTILSVMTQDGLLHVGRTKQGTLLSEKGRAFYQTLCAQ